jgi:membrane protease YdiL (CAAX protease family)
VKRFDSPGSAIALTLVISAVHVWLVFGGVFETQISAQLVACTFTLAATVPLIWGELRDALKVSVRTFVNYAGLIFLAFTAGRVVLAAFGMETIMVLPPGHELNQTPILTALVFVVLGPLNEELLFRGYLLPRLLPLEFVPAAAITSAIWAGTHVSYSTVSVVFIFCFGLLLAWVVKRTGSVWVTFAGHVLINLEPALFLLFFNH